MRLTSRVALAAIASAIVLSSCGGAQPRALRHAATVPVSVRLTFASTTVDVGSPLQGVATVTNNTSRDILVTRCSQGRWLTVGIATSRWTYLPVRGAVACAPSVRLVPGENRFPFSVITTYRICGREFWRHGQLVRRPTAPQCMVGGARPPLPDGYYVTRTIVNGLPAGTRPPSPVHVTLVPRSTVSLGTTIQMPYPEIPYSDVLYVPRYPTSRVAVTLRKVDDPATPGDEARFFDPAAARRWHFTARRGYHYVSFELTVKDVGRISLAGNVDAQVGLLGTDNNWYSTMWCFFDGMCRGPGAGGSYTLAPGKAATGDVIFSVPDGVRIGFVSFRTDSAQSGWELIPAA
jgi:hypothetical protein